MSLIWFLSGTAALVLLYTLYRATSNCAAGRSGHEGGEELPESSYPNSRNRVPAVDSSDFVESCEFPRDYIFFDIWSDSTELDSAWHGGSPISFDEFEDSIRWIPLESEIVVRQVGGANAHFLKRIAVLPTERKILVLVEKSPGFAGSEPYERDSK